MEIMLNIITKLVKLIKWPITIILKLLPPIIRIYLSEVDTFLRFSAVSKELYKLVDAYNLKDKNKITLLDVGGGNGTLFFFINNKKYDLSILDNDKSAINNSSGRKLKTIFADGCSLPLKNDSFDFVTCIAAFQYVPLDNREIFLSELQRVAKYGVVLYTPTISALEIEKKLHAFRKMLKIPDPWLSLELQIGLPHPLEIKKTLQGVKYKGMQNQKMWYYTMILESIPIINLFIPGIVYFFLKNFDNKPPYLGYLFIWKKRFLNN